MAKPTSLDLGRLMAPAHRHEKLSHLWNRVESQLQVRGKEHDFLTVGCETETGRPPRCACSWEHAAAKPHCTKQATGGDLPDLEPPVRVRATFAEDVRLKHR